MPVLLRFDYNVIGFCAFTWRPRTESNGFIDSQRLSEQQTCSIFDVQNATDTTNVHSCGRVPHTHHAQRGATIQKRHNITHALISQPGKISTAGLATRDCKVPRGKISRHRACQRRQPTTSNCKINGRFSVQNHRFSGVILHSFCIFDGKLKKWLAIYIAICSTVHVRAQQGGIQCTLGVLLNYLELQ